MRNPETDHYEENRQSEVMISIHAISSDSNAQVAAVA
jgi:hypothetical protein